jgi:hypothetical protein
MSSSKASVCSSRGDPKMQYKVPEGYNSGYESGAPSSYCYDTKEIDSSSKEESGKYFDLNWELEDSSKPVINEETGQVNE